MYKPWLGLIAQIHVTWQARAFTKNFADQALVFALGPRVIVKIEQGTIRLFSTLYFRLIFASFSKDLISGKVHKLAFLGIRRPKSLGMDLLN